MPILNVCVFFFNIYIYIYAIMETMGYPGYHQNGFVVTHTLGKSNSNGFVTTQIVYHVPKCMSCHKPIAMITEGAHCFYDCIYISLILLIARQQMVFTREELFEVVIESWP